MTTAKRQRYCKPGLGRCAVIVLAVMALVPITVLAQRHSTSSPALRQLLSARSPLLRTQNVDIGESAAADAAASATGGRVLNVKRAGEHVYQVKVLLRGGKLRIVRVDARSGKVK